MQWANYICTNTSFKVVLLFAKICKSDINYNWSRNNLHASLNFFKAVMHANRAKSYFSLTSLFWTTKILNFCSTWMINVYFQINIILRYLFWEGQEETVDIREIANISDLTVAFVWRLWDSCGMIVLQMNLLYLVRAGFRKKAWFFIKNVPNYRLISFFIFI